MILDLLSIRAESKYRLSDFKVSRARHHAALSDASDVNASGQAWRMGSVRAGRKSGCKEAAQAGSDK